LKFYPLKVSSIKKTTDDCSIISLEVPAGLRETFHYKAGQYLTFEEDLNGEKVRRCYSLCSNPNKYEWRIGVKKIEGGKFSTFANDVLKVGDKLQTMPPEGNFFVDLKPETQRNYVAFAAGSGITPIASIIQTHLEAEPLSTFKLFYIKLFNGRLNEEKLTQIFKTLCNAGLVDHFFSCGPEAMIKCIETFLLGVDVKQQKIHFELFGTNTGENKQKADSIKAQFKGEQCNT